MQPDVAFDRLTRHATQRASQRGVTRAAIGHLWSLSDQEIPVAADLHACSISRAAIAEAIADGARPADMARLARLALVEAADGAIVTVARIHGRKGRHYRRRIRRYWRD